MPPQCGDLKGNRIQTVCINAERHKMSIADILTAQHLTTGRRACWAPYLKAEFNKPYMCELRRHLIREEAKYEILPQPRRIFEALDETTLDEVKVVIIGQDPYPAPGQAHGLAFSVECGKRPTSLSKIFAEVGRNMNECLPPGSNRCAVANGCNCLTPWARQGVLLLNQALTVRKDCAGSHCGKGWERFTDRIVETINERREHVVFMLWGKEVQRQGACIDCERNLVLQARHPRIGINGSRHFSRANQYLERHNIEPIDWLDVCWRPPLEEQEASPPLTVADANDEVQWDRAFAASRPQLERLAAEAAQERRLGLTKELGPMRR